MNRRIMKGLEVGALSARQSYYYKMHKKRWEEKFNKAYPEPTIGKFGIFQGIIFK